jgi:hypothetical protein
LFRFIRKLRSKKGKKLLSSWRINLGIGFGLLVSFLDVFKKEDSRDPTDEEESRDLTLDVNAALGSQLPDPVDHLFNFGAITVVGSEGASSNDKLGAWYAYDPSCHQLILMVDGSYVGTTFELSTHPQLRDDWVFTEYEVLTLEYLEQSVDQVSEEDESAFALTWDHGLAGLGAFLLPFGSASESAVASSAVIANEAPTIVVSATAFAEDDPAVTEGAIVASYVTTDDDGDNVSVAFTSGSSPTDESGAALYTLDTASNEVKLTEAGAAFVNAGNDLPAVELTATDDGTGTLSSTGSDQPIVIKVNDAPTIELLANDFTEDDPSVIEDAVVASYETADEEGDNVSVAFTSGGSPTDASGAALYTLDTATNQVKLTSAGAAYVNAGNDLPEVQLTATDDGVGNLTGTGSDDPVVTLVNDAPTIEVLANDFTEDDPSVTESAVVASYVTADEDGDNISVVFTSGSSPTDASGAALYTLDTATNQVKLTSAGAAYVNAGNDLPEVQLTATDDGVGNLTGTGSDDPVVTLVNDAPTIEVLANDFIEKDPSVTESAVVATYVTADEEGDNVSVAFTSGSSPTDASGAALYTLDTATNQVKLTSAGAAYVNAGNDLPAVELTVTEESAENLTGTGSDDPVVTLVNDAPNVLLDAQISSQDNTAVFSKSLLETTQKGVAFTTIGTSLSDQDSNDLSNLTVSIDQSEIESGDQLLLAENTISLTSTSPITGEVNQAGTAFAYLVEDVSGTVVVTFSSLAESGGTELAAAITSYEVLLDGLIYNNVAEQFTDRSTRSFDVVANDGFVDSNLATFTVTLDAVKDSVILGTDSADTLDGLGGDDALVGGDGDDILIGSEGDDYILGGTGNDTISGNEGDDIADGGSGDDIYSFDIDEENADFQDIFIGGTGIDTVRFADMLTSYQITLVDEEQRTVLNEIIVTDSERFRDVEASEGFSSSEPIYFIQKTDPNIDGSLYQSGFIQAEYLQFSDVTLQFNSDGSQQIIATDSNEPLIFDGLSYENPIWMPLNVVGGTVSDRLISGSGDDTLNGQAGDDILVSRAGNDQLFGGEGNDIFAVLATDDASQAVRSVSMNGGAGSDAFFLKYIAGTNSLNFIVEDFVVGEDVIDFEGIFKPGESAGAIEPLTVSDILGTDAIDLTDQQLIINFSDFLSEDGDVLEDVSVTLNLSESIAEDAIESIFPTSGSIADELSGDWWNTLLSESGGQV